MGLESRCNEMYIVESIIYDEVWLLKSTPTVPENKYNCRAEFITKYKTSPYFFSHFHLVILINAYQP